MPSAKSSKKGKNSAQKPKKGQLLISRFFSARPKAESTPPPLTAKPKASATSPAAVPLTDQPEQRDVSEHDGDTPATQVTTPHESEELRSSSSPEKATRTGDVSRLRKRRRLFIVRDDSDHDGPDEGETGPLRKTARKADEDKDPDFAIDADSEEDGELPRGGSVVDSDEEMQDENSSHDEPHETETATGVSEPGTTLESYGHDRRMTEVAEPLPRDAKRRRQFTQKIGRLEKNSFFLRRTGGGGDASKPGETESGRKKATKYTPLEAQYVEMHRKHPDKLLVVECGYKYRMFDQHAAAASKVLRVASYFDHNFLTASFPTHRLAHHVRRLVQAGHKVGVVTQSETAALKKASEKSSKLFQRKLTAVYTKGTIAADGKLQAAEQGSGKGLSSSASYIMAVLEFGSVENDGAPAQTRKIAMAAVDSATGEVLFDSFVDDVLRSDLESRLVALEPVELLVSKDGMSKQTNLVVKSYCENMSARLESVKSSTFDRNDDAVGSLNNTVEVQYNHAKDELEAVLSCLGALAAYLKQFHLELSMSSAMEFKSFRSSRQMTIGADVLRSFEVFGNSNSGSVEGSLIGLLNRTRTAFGGRQMRQWVSHPLVHSTEIADRLDAVEYLRDKVEGYDAHLGENETLAKAVAELIKSLPGLPDLEQGLTRISCHKCTPSEFLAVVRAFEGIGERIDLLKSLTDLTGLPALLTKLLSATPVVGETLGGCVLEAVNREAAANDVYHQLFKHDYPLTGDLKNISSAQEFLDLAEELGNANTDVLGCEKAMSTLLRRLQKSHSFPKWDWKKVANEEYLLEVPVSKTSSIPHSWPIVCQTKAVKRFRPPEAARGYEKVQCARETRDAISSRCWRAYLEVFTTVATPLRAVVRILVDLDCLAALARVANLPGYSKPSIVLDPSIPAGIQATEARHPLTEALQTSASYVPNDVNLGRGADEIALVISGPNYGGKSSYARMTALLVMLAQIGSYVPAKSAAVSPFDSVHARMGSTDSIAKGMSSLMVELAETSRILSTATCRSLVVLDELGRGTSTHDGTAIAYATLSHLVGEVKCVSLFVTHYPMLATLRSVYPHQIGAYYMDYLEEKPRQGVRSSENATNSDSDEATTAKARITFLYKLVKGVASSSYGLNVARLAGIPVDVIEDAGEKATELEEQLQELRDQNSVHRYLRNVSWSSEESAGKMLLELTK